LAGRVVLDSLVEPYSGSILDGQVEWDGRGSDLLGAEASLRLTLGPSRLGEVAMDSALLALSWSRGAGAFRGRATSPRGSVSWDGSASVTEAGGEVRLVRMDLDSLIPTVGADPPDPGGDGVDPHPTFLVSGRLAGNVGWNGTPAAVVDPTRILGSVTFTDRGSRLGPLDLEEASLRIDWNRGAAALEARAALPDSGRVELAADGTVLDSLTVGIRRGRFRNVDLAGFLASSPSTDLSGQIEGSLRRSGGGGLVSSLAIRTDPSRVGLDTVRVLDASLELRPDTIQADIRAELGGGRARGRLSARPSAEMGRDGQPESEASVGEAIQVWQVDLDADLPRLGGFFGRPDSSVALQARGRASGGAEPGSTRWELAVQHAAAWGAQVDTAVASGSLDSAVLRVDTVMVRSDVLAADGGGELPTTGLWRGPDLLDTVPVTDTATRRFALLVELADTATALQPVADLRLVAGEGSMQVGTVCAPDGCTLDGVLDLGPLVVNQYAVAASRMELEGALAPGPSVRGARADVSIQGIRTPSAGIRTAEASISYDGEIVDLDASTVIDGQRDATLGLVLDPRPDRRLVTIRDVRFRMDQDQWRLRRPTTLRYGNGELAMDTLELSAAGQRIHVQGVWDGARGHDFTVLLDSVRVGTVSDLAGAPGLDGWIDARVDGRGDGDRPLFEAEASGRLSYRGRRLHRFHVRADRGNEHLRVDAELTDSLQRRRLQIAGDIPAGAERPGDWDLRVQADSVPLRWAQPYVDPDVARGLSGELRAHLTIRGSRMAPLAEGPLEVDQGSVTLPAAGITLSEVRLRSTVRDRALELDTLRARSGGVIGGAGVLTLPSLDDPVGMDLGFRAESFLVANTPFVRATIDGELELGGDVRRPRLTGTVDVIEADIRMNRALGGADVEDVTLTATDWATLQTRFGIPPPQETEAPAHALEATELDLSVELGRDIWLRQEVNPELAVQFTGDVAVRKSADSDDVRLRGRLEAVPQRSYMEQFGRRFKLEEGSVLLRGAPEDTRVQLTSVYEVPPRNGDASEVDIRLALAGDVGNMSLTLSSDPPMENVDIVSYLATGRPASSALSGGEGRDGSSFTDLGTEVVASRLTSLVERFAMNDVGLDVVEIRREGLDEATLVAGRYVTPELFLGFRQPVSFGRTDDAPVGPGSSEAEIEWRALRWLLLNLQTGGQAFRFFLEGSLGF
ncbi:MAG: translocation/assembly module TamB domain-containing protein, partial [Gemmatimonadota bacterium]